MNVVERVLSFWFQEEFLDLAADGDYRAAWFKKNNAFDQAIKNQFETDVVAAAAGKYNELEKTVEGVLALTLLLDQFPRNIYRGLPKAYATDSLALTIAKNAIAALKMPRGRFGEILEFKFKIFKYSQLPIITKNRYNPNSDTG